MDQKESQAYVAFQIATRALHEAQEHLKSAQAVYQDALAALHQFAIQKPPPPEQ